MPQSSNAYDLAAFIGLALMVFGVASKLGSRSDSLWPQRLLVAGVAVRVLGAWVRYEVTLGVYGRGDAFAYYAESLPMAQALRALEISPFGPSFWTGGGYRWGTGFVTRISALILAVTGPSLRAEFLVFSLFAFAGLLLMAKAFARMQPERAIVYASWIWLWPSLWFWPSSVGKEALILLAVGLATLGYVGTGTAIRWPLLVAGLALAFLVRPHVAAVVAIALGVAEWLASWNKASVRRVVEGLLLGVLSVGLMLATLRQFGRERPELEGVVEFVEWERGQTLQGGSNVGSVSLSPTGVLGAIVNTWMRPFPWEAHNAQAMVAAAEMAGFWLLVVARRGPLLLALKHWRTHRMLRFGLPFLMAYTLMIGVAFGNLGLIARQRSPIFPFMLLFVLAVPGLSAFEQRRLDPPPRTREREAMGATR